MQTFWTDKVQLRRKVLHVPPFSNSEATVKKPWINFDSCTYMSQNWQLKTNVSITNQPLTRKKRINVSWLTISEESGLQDRQEITKMRHEQSFK